MEKERKYILLGNLLRAKGLITDEQLQYALLEQKRTKKILGQTLVDLGFIDRNKLLDVLIEQFGLRREEIGEIPKEVIEKIPLSVALSYKTVPLRLEKDKLIIGFSDPLNVDFLDNLRFALGTDIEGVIVEEKQLEEAFLNYYGKLPEKEEVIELPRTEGIKKDYEDLINQPPVVKLLNLVFSQAIRERASDLHFEPCKDEFRVRARIDGFLREIVKVPKELALALVSRIKVLSGLDVSESRIPQDGRLMVETENVSVDLRVATLPTVFGESAVLRVLDRRQFELSFEELGIEESLRKRIKTALRRPQGLILVSGPSGSGKTTTLYACLKEIKNTTAKMITVEDPVEYDMSEILHIPINLKIGLDFAKVLRHLLRHDPDIIMIGEIRDIETAEFSIRAALTGHLVLTSLHANDVPSSITRLIDMGVEPFLVSSTLSIVITQRLIRLLCNYCKYEDETQKELLGELGFSKDEFKDAVFYKAKGCPQCNYIGYKGRTGIFEILIFDERLKREILENKEISVLKKIILDIGMKTLKEDALNKCIQGITSLEEVVRQTREA